ncbi:MAG: hypothetical protein H0Z31_05785 [Bacillus sp. (in: Bacteria)]|nr:hypothetical protein [Bacillus sp. (in: firmicutes)]
MERHLLRLRAQLGLLIIVTSFVLPFVTIIPMKIFIAQFTNETAFGILLQGYIFSVLSFLCFGIGLVVWSSKRLILLISAMGLFVTSFICFWMSLNGYPSVRNKIITGSLWKNDHYLLQEDVYVSKEFGLTYLYLQDGPVDVVPLLFTNPSFDNFFNESIKSNN